MNSIKYFILAWALLIQSCASLSSGGRNVREFSGTVPPSCQFLGGISGSSASSVGTDHRYIATVDLKNQTAKAGGNFYRVVNDNSAELFGKMDAEVYSCRETTNWVVREPSAEEKLAYELKRQNDNAEAEQRIRGLQQFQRSLSSPAEPQKKNTQCTSTVNSHFGTINTSCQEN